MVILCVKFISVNHLFISLIYLFNIFGTSLPHILDIFVIALFFIEFSFSLNHWFSSGTVGGCEGYVYIYHCPYIEWERGL